MISPPHHPGRPPAQDRQETATTRTDWTAARIRALGPVTTVPVAAQIFGLSRSVAYELIRLGRFPVPVLHFGSRYRIPVAAILTALHLPVDDPPARDISPLETHRTGA